MIATQRPGMVFPLPVTVSVFLPQSANGCSQQYDLEAGEESREQLMADIDRGLYITDVMGMHTANPISGDFP